MSLPHLPRLKPSIDVFAAGDGRIHLFRGGEDDFVIDDPGAAVLTLLRRMDGTRTLPALASHEDLSKTVAAVAQLSELGLVEDAADDLRLAPDELARYERQLRYFGDVASAGQTRVDYQERLASARVAVLGLGGLGGWAALALASAGVGTMVGVDADVVELSNLNRQVLYAEADLGRAKTEAAGERLRALNSRLRFEPVSTWLTSAAEVREVVAGCDFVIDAVDTPVHDIEGWVNDGCFAAGIPFLMMSQFPPLVRVGPTFVPGEPACYRCQERAWAEQYPLFEELRAHRRLHPCPAASFGPACAFIGAQVALEVTHSLTGISRPATHGRSLTTDLRTMATTWDVVQPDPRCTICSQGASAAKAERAASPPRKLTAVAPS